MYKKSGIQASFSLILLLSFFPRNYPRTLSQILHSNFIAPAIENGGGGGWIPRCGGGRPAAAAAAAAVDTGVNAADAATLVGGGGAGAAPGGGGGGGGCGGCPPVGEAPMRWCAVRVSVNADMAAADAAAAEAASILSLVIRSSCFLRARRSLARRF